MNARRTQLVPLVAAGVLAGAGAVYASARLVVSGPGSAAAARRPPAPLLRFGRAGTTANRLLLPVSNLRPGLVVLRSADLRNARRLRLARIALWIEPTVSSLLDQDVREGLRVRIERCSRGWAERVRPDAIAYSCPARRRVLVAWRPLVTRDLVIRGLASRWPGGVDHLLFSFALPPSAGNAFEGQTSTVSYRFTALRARR